MIEAKQLAELNGTFLKQFPVSLIAERVGELRATADIRVRAERANPAAAQAVLARASDRPPLAGDELPGTHCVARRWG